MSNNEYRRKIQLLYYYKNKKNKTNNDLDKIEELNEDIKLIKIANKNKIKKIKCQFELDKLKNSWENGYINMFDVEDVLFYLEMQR